MKKIPHLKPILLLLLVICLLAPLQPAWADSATVTISTAASSNGSWSGATPDVWTPGASGVSTVAVSEITDRLANSGVIIGSGSSITVATPISWSSSNSLTLNAGTDIAITAAISSSSGALTLAAGTTISATDQISVNIFTLSSGSWSQIGSLPGFSASDFRISGGSFIRALGGDGSSSNPYQITDIYGLQGIGSSGMLVNSYQLANDISASGTATWNSGKGFKPIGDSSHTFTGSLGGQSHTINGLTINRDSEILVGFFGINYGTISNLVLTNAAVTGGDVCVGALVGCNMEGGIISNVSVQGNVIGTVDQVGLLTGGNGDGGMISNVTASGSVSGLSDVGGLVGVNWGVLSNASASVTVTGTYDEVGGLVGENAGSINSSHASGNVTGNKYVGGLVGHNVIGTASDAGRIIDVYATGTVSGVNSVGGLIGTSDANTVISNAYATGNVTGTEGVGGLVGHNDGGSISVSYATGSVTGGSGSNMLGGLVGYNNSGSISASYAIGSVSGDEFAGGLVGWNHGSINTSYATGTVTATLDVAGGLVGENTHGSISNSYATGSVSSNTFVGGLVGANENSATISNSYAIGKVTGNSYTSVGGLAGINTADSSISNSFFNSDPPGQDSAVGGNAGTLTNVVGKTTSELKTASSFSDAGWSISATGGSPAIWRIYEGKTYPLLRSFLTAMSVTANNAAKNYDGTAYNGGNGVQYAPAGYNADRVAGTLSYSGSSQGATAIGSYTITPDGLFSDQLGYDISFISGALNINGYWLTLGISGSGSVNSSNGSGLGYACNTATCSAVPFGSNDTVTLTATGSNSSFSSWSGDYVSISNPGSITMNASKAITATFSAGAATVKIDGDSTSYYSINSALAAPTQDAIIKATAIGFAENVILQNSHTLTLKGGYSDSNFSSQTGYSTINGSLTISSGTLVVDKVVVGP
ncbi:The GLUG motif-containing protein [Trichlorobacter thiogenes]|uniref:The GLUG motif-containing protein n=1 Tax=Trichlorobacter thiogenes TaxID=115783 RepID=A0A1T4P919_9BACT|nr:GLUG motif-containing protein [Trichlorobacter thiogenes]SJZ88070.1 The GLUG motif-containing protein [Trichlorobacter thiogenes]